MAKKPSRRMYSYRGSRGAELLQRAARKNCGREQVVTRKQIVEAALKLFRQKGYLGTSMADIADAVGLTKGGIYHHIESKEDLLRELHDEMISAVFDRIKLGVESELDPGKQLVNWVRMHTSVMHDYLDQISVFFRDFKHLEPSSLKRMTQRRDEVQQRLSDIIRSGVRSGQFRKGIDPDIAAFLVLGTVNWFYQWYRPKGKLSLEEITRMSVEIVCHGICR